MVLLVFRGILKKSNSEPDTSMDEFWEHEREAMFARSKDLSKLDLEYFEPDTASLPFHSDDFVLPDGSAPDSELFTIEQQVLERSKEPMIDLHEMSNTDLKIAYGPNNFPTLSKYDQNYLYFVRDLFKWGKYLYDNKLRDDAVIVLEYTLKMSDDVSGAYSMLGTIYRDKGEIGRITELLHIAEESDSISKDSICSNLKDLINSY